MIHGKAEDTTPCTTVDREAITIATATGITGLLLPQEVALQM